MIGFFTVGMVLFIVVVAVVGAGTGLIFSSVKDWYQANRETDFWWDSKPVEEEKRDL